MMFSRRAWIFAIFVAVSPAVAGEISGAAHVIDGDTIEIGATKVRLFGIDAPESAQTCRAVVEKAYPCGEAATARVRQMTEGRPITCKGHEHDRYGRLLGVCSVGGVEINRTLVPIYHMPWQRDYAKVNMDKGLGERWFCDEGEA